MKAQTAKNLFEAIYNGVQQYGGSRIGDIDVVLAYEIKAHVCHYLSLRFLECLESNQEFSDSCILKLWKDIAD